MEWFIDGVKVHEIVRGQSVVAGMGPHHWEHWPEEDMHLILNNAVMTHRPDKDANLIAPDDPSAYPNALRIKYLSVFQAPP